MFSLLIAYASPLLLASVALSVCALYAARRSEVSGAPMLAWLAGSVAVWSFCYALELLAGPIDVKIAWAKAQYLGIAGAPLAWLLFTVTFAGRPAWLNRQVLALLLIVPAFTLALALTNELHGLIWQHVALNQGGPLPLLVVTHGPWFWFYALYSYALMLWGNAMLIAHVVSRPAFYRRQLAALLLSAVVPWAGNAIYLARIPPFDVLDATPFAFTLSTLIFGHALLRGRLLDLVPVARDALVGDMQDGLIVLDLHGRVVDHNRAAERIFTPDRPLRVGDRAEQVFARYPELARAPLQLGRFEAAIVAEGGDRRTYEISVDPVVDTRGKITGRLMLARDVTERTREAETRRFLLAEQATVQRVARAINSAIELDQVFQTVVQQIHAAFNHEIVSIWLREGEHLCVRAYHGYGSPPEPFPLTKGVIGRVLRQGRAAFVHDASADPDFVYVRRDSCQAIVVPLSARDGEPMGVLLIESTAARPLTEADYALMLLLADQVSVAVTNARLFDELRAAKRAAEQATLDRSTFLAHMSHELRSSSQSVVSVSESLLRTALTPEQHALVLYAANSTRALLDLLNDTLDVAKIEAQRLTLASAPFALHECIDSAVEQVAPAAAAKQIDVVTVLGPEVPPQIVGDRTRLRQILVNLLANAIKFSSSGDVTVTVSAAPGADGRTKLDFAVRDTGIGIPPEAMPTLFQPFVQSERTLHAYSGTGLGLAISRQLSELMGGTMWAGSDGATGSTFFFSIVASVAPEGAAQPRLRGAQVLLLADDTPARAALVSQLEREGARVRATADTAAACEWLAEDAAFSLALVGFDTPARHTSSAAIAARAPELPLLQLAWLRPISEPSGALSLYRGTVFRPITAVSLWPAIERALAPDDAPPLVAPSPVGDTLNILVADDDAFSRRLARRLLEGCGHQVTAVESGRAALEALALSPFDIALLDIHMADMGGLELVAKIRRGTPAAALPFLIALTGDVLPESLDRYRAAGIDHVIAKPLRSPELIGALSACGTRRASRAALAELRDAYLAEVARLIEALDSAFALRDYAALGGAAHRLCGAGDLFGADSIARLAAQIEAAVRADEAESLPPLLAALRVAYEDVAAEGSAAVPRPPLLERER